MDRPLDLTALVGRSLADQAITRDDARAVLGWPEDRLLELLDAAFRVRRVHFGLRVKICVLQNARSGLCPEDCHYCSQSIISTAPIKKYRLLPVDELLDGARRACEAGAKRYCMVTSGRGPSDADIEHLCQAARKIRAQYPVELCVSLGLMSESQAVELKASGIGWVNHNLNTSERHHGEICTTHTYQDRLNTIRNVQRAGMQTCSGGIIGMGETDEDILDFAYALRELSVNSLPVNFLHPIEGTPMAGYRQLTPSRCLKVLCLVRFLNPRSDIRAAGGREVNLRSLQPLALYPANSIFVEGYLTTPGQAQEAAQQMVRDLGFELEAFDSGASCQTDEGLRVALAAEGETG